MRRITTFSILLIIVGAVFLFFRDSIFEGLPEVKREGLAVVKEAREQISAPPPLIVEVRLPESFLTPEGIVRWTNIQRANNGLPFLKENPKLNSSALAKVEDMLAKQYFAHISPSGQGVGDLAKQAGYEFIAIGENLALGDFENDEELVRAWMDSPGHRENILNPQYQEIGVAVLQGEFGGRKTWLSVQHFARPLSACPKPSETLIAEISENQSKIEQMYFELSALQEEINQQKLRHDPEYNQKVEQYNLLVSEYNALIDETKMLIEQYNSQVRLFNACAQGA